MVIARRVAALTRRSPRLHETLRQSWSWANGHLPPYAVDGVGLVHRNDLMYLRGQPQAAEHYQAVGRQAAEFIDKHHRLVEAEAVLDFGCGHGRVARELAKRVRPGRLSVCDIDQEAVSFCAWNFRASPVLATPDPASLVLGDYDVIWMGSVLTHLAREPATRLLIRLTEALLPGGLLAFTTHGLRAERDADELAARSDMQVADIRQELDATGWAYRKYPHYSSDYGLAWTRDSAIENVVSGLPVALTLVDHVADAWGEWQDLWAFRRTS